MNHTFKLFIDSLEPMFQELTDMLPLKYRELPSNIPKRGIYLFTENRKHLYVGRTNRLRERLRGHCIPSASHFTATFAFRLAREKSGLLKATYKVEGSRKALITHEVFGPAFIEAKARISEMEIRYVEVTDPVSQALLEIYVATVLNTPYNDFDNH
jgi:predicted GIY-YIG superfamily endonuclease